MKSTTMQLICNFSVNVNEALFQPVKIKPGELVKNDEKGDKQVAIRNILYIKTDVKLDQIKLGVFSENEGS